MEIQGKFGRNSGAIGGKIGELCFPNGETELPGVPPNQGKGEKMRENCFTKNPIWVICVKQVREIKVITFLPQVSIAQYCIGFQSILTSLI